MRPYDGHLYDPRDIGNFFDNHNVKDSDFMFGATSAPPEIRASRDAGIREAMFAKNFQPPPYEESIPPALAQSLGGASPAPSLNTLSSVAPMAASALGRTPGGFMPFMAANAISSGVGAVSSYFQNRERLAQQEKLSQRDFDAAHQVGLSHPSQLQSISSQLGKYKGGRIQSIARTIGSSPYSF